MLRRGVTIHFSLMHSLRFSKTEVVIRRVFHFLSVIRSLSIFFTTKFFTFFVLFVLPPRWSFWTMPTVPFLLEILIHCWTQYCFGRFSVLWPLTVLEEEYRECVLSLGLSSGLANCPPGVSVIVRTPRWKYDNTLTWHVYFFIDLKSFYFKNCSLFYYLFCILHPVYILQIRPPLEMIREEEGYIQTGRQRSSLLVGGRTWMLH